MDRITEYVQMAREAERLYRWQQAAAMWRRALNNDRYATVQVVCHYRERIAECERKGGEVQ